MISQLGVVQEQNMQRIVELENSLQVAARASNLKEESLQFEILRLTDEISRLRSESRSLFDRLQSKRTLETSSPTKPVEINHNESTCIAIPESIESMKMKLVALDELAQRLL